MKIGTSQVDITPHAPFFLGGSASLRLNKQIHDPLYASAIAVLSKGEALILVSCDLVNIKNQYVEYIRSKVSSLTGVKQDNIIIAATHTHQGPKNGLNFPMPWNLPDEDMVLCVMDGIARAAVDAWSSMKSARMGYACGSVDKVTFNRRCIMSNGRSAFVSKRGHDPLRLIPEGPVDKAVQVLWFEDTDRNPLAVIVNFACHPTVMFKREAVSADFPGAARKAIQKVIGNEVPVLYLQGACGNTYNIDYDDEITVCEGPEGLARIGRIIGGEVLKLMSEYAAAYEEPSLKIISRLVNIPYRKISEDEYINALKVWSELSDEQKADTVNFRLPYLAFSTVELYRQMLVKPAYPCELTVIRLGDIFIATNPTELFVEYQLELKKRFSKLIVSELTNGHAGYVPTRLAFALGGYEMERSLHSKLDESAGELIIENTAELINLLQHP